MGKQIEEYDPPKVHVETFEVKRYSFDSGNGFICVTKGLEDTLPLGRENGSRFREMIQKELDTGGKFRRKTFAGSNSKEMEFEVTSTRNYVVELLLSTAITA
ncbi:hypothetical protein Tco_1134867 [Tanacetum coccineum]